MKKFRNKFLTSLAILTMAGAGLAACGDETTSETEKKYSEEFTTAMRYMKEVYKDEDGKTKPADFELIGAYTDEQDRAFTINWTLEVLTSGAEDSVKLVVGKTKDGKDDPAKVTVDIDEESEIDVDYRLKATISYGEEEAEFANFTLKMPKLHIATWEEYAEACKKGGSKKGDAKNKFYGVEGIVTTLIGTKNGNSTQAIYVQSLDNKGAFYGYGLDSDPADKVEIGQKVRLTGETAIYSGTYELVGCSITKILDTNKTTVLPVDYTEKYAAAADLKDASITDAQGLYVEIKDVTITGEDLSKGYFNFKKGDLETYVRISSSVCPIPKAAQDQMKADHAAKAGWTADVKGIINVYDGNFYLTPIDAQPFTFKSLPELDDAGAVAFEKDRLTTSLEITKSGDVALPTAGGSYTDVTITWASSNATLAAIASDNSKVTYTLGESVEEVTLTATLKRGSETATKEFKVSVVGVIPWKTVAEVKELEKDIANNVPSTKNYYVYGEITTDPTTDYCNFTLSSGDDDILVWGVLKEAGQAYGSKKQIADIPFKKGDKFFCNAKVEKFDEKWELIDAVAMETPAVGSTFANPMDPAAAIAACGLLDNSKNEISKEKYFIQGTVIDDPTANFCNFNFSNGEKNLLVYGLSNDEGKAYGTSKDIAEIPIKKGDVVMIQANLEHFKRDETVKLEAVNAVLVSFYTPAAPFEVVHAGTAADPYTVAEALFIGKSLSESKYNNDKKGNEYGEIKNCYVKGIITTGGTYNGETKSQNNFKLKDSADGKELLVYTANFVDAEGNADANARAYVNDTVVVKGALMLYSGTVEISSVVTYEDELSDGKYVVKSTAYPNFVSITTGKSAVTLGAHEGATVEGLPTETLDNGSTVSNVTVTADSGKVVKAVKVNGSAITAADGKYSFKVEGPVTFTVETADANAIVESDVATFVKANTNNLSKTGGTITADNGLVWTMSSLNDKPLYKENEHIGIGTGNVPLNGTVTFTATTTGKVKEVIVNALVANGGDTKVSISFASAEILAETAMTTTATDYKGTVAAPAAGTIVVSFKNTAKQIKVKSITVKYDTAA
ncbi:MAG: hypothetical protein K6E21_03045 [Bacilli bacterium]|nr:hypothetical protein [Bacilli bacterium]